MAMTLLEVVGKLSGEMIEVRRPKGGEKNPQNWPKSTPDLSRQFSDFFDKLT